MPPLSHLDVLVIDCQATAASPKGHLLELGWGRAGAAAGPVSARLIKLPAHGRIPPGVSRITGITDRMMAAAVDPAEAWGELRAQASALSPQPAPAVAHFARFERPFLAALAGGAPPLDLVCTHEIARRLLPGLPRRTLRALTGYFGGAVGPCRRSEDHVNATAFVWRALVGLLEAEDVTTWSGLREWLAHPVQAAAPRRRVWPMPRAVRLALPDGPGIYRMLRSSGDVLYVGKASSLHHRVNSYFRKQHGIPERLLEMLSQARNISIEVTPTILEAALLEADEIKRQQPPYNRALTLEDRDVWFATRDLRQRSATPSSRHPAGPFPSAQILDEFAALAGDADTAPRQLLRLATRLWREGRRPVNADLMDDLPLWSSTPEHEQMSREWIALRASLARRRGRWLTRLMDASIAWTEPGTPGGRLLVIENGEIIARGWLDDGADPPVPPGHARPAAARHQAMTVPTYDRLRVLSTELKRVAADGGDVAIRFGRARPLRGARLARAFAWV